MENTSTRRGFTQSVMLNSFQHLHLNHPSYKAEEILKQVQDDNRMGFTLIELLVVVLIIGILAAVALPQYRFAVEKSRTAEARLMLNEVYKGYQLCVLQHGADAEQCTTGLLDNLDVQLPGEVIPCLGDSESCVITKGWVYEWDTAALYANRMDSFEEEIDGYQYYLMMAVSDGKIKCYDGENTWFCPKLCGSDACEIK